MRRRKFLSHVAGTLASVPLVSHAKVEGRCSGFSRSAEPIAVNSARQLFIDNSLIAEGRGVHLTVNRPAPTGERCLIADKPWEGLMINGYNPVMEDKLHGATPLARFDLTELIAYPPF